MCEAESTAQGHHPNGGTAWPPIAAGPLYPYPPLPVPQLVSGHWGLAAGLCGQHLHGSLLLQGAAITRCLLPLWWHFHEGPTQKGAFYLSATASVCCFLPVCCCLVSVAFYLSAVDSVCCFLPVCHCWLCCGFKQKYVHVHEFLSITLFNLSVGLRSWICIGALNL